jgi:hypothetical protein
MKAHESIEAALMRLMPPALSDDARISIESMLDELAEEASREAPHAARSGHAKAITAAAAAVALMAGGLAWVSRDVRPGPLVTTGSLSPGMVLVGESDRIESVEDEGWFADPDGGEVRAVRVRMVGEDSFRDEETGIVFLISEPREETLLMPVSAF